MELEKNNLEWQNINADNFEWQDEYNVGVEIIDKAHKKLFSVVRRLNNFVNAEDNEKNKWICTEGIKFLKEYALQHFAQEEAYMRSINFVGYGEHKRQHTELKEIALPAIEKEMEENNYSFTSVQKFLGICIGWLTGHIMIYDRGITKTIAPNIDLYRMAEYNVDFGKAVAKIMNDVFTIKAQIASEHFGGKDIGEALNYELSYCNHFNQKMKALIILEDRLVLHAVGQMADTEFKKVDGVVISATEELIKMFFKQVNLLIHDPADIHTYKDLKRIENDETKEMIKNIDFHRKLLFNTELGYFVICTSNPEKQI